MSAQRISAQFGRNLAEAREWAGLTQTEVAREAATVQPEVSRYERGLVCPRLDTVAKLAEAVGVQLRDLLFDIE